MYKGIILVVYLFLVEVSSKELGEEEILARTLYMECRGEDWKGKHGVLSVIWNRCNSRGKSIKEVCLARKQFSCWNKQKKRKRRIREEKEYDENIDLAKFFIYNFKYWRSSVGSKEYFYSIKIREPKWAKNRKKHRIGGHIFC